MTERARNIAVGFTAMAGLAALAYMMLLFGYIPLWVSGGYQVKVELSHAAGIGPGTLVFLNGIEVGRVLDVHLKDSPQQGVMVTTRINGDILLKQGVQVKVNSASFTGSTSLTLDWSQVQPDAKPLPTDGSAVLIGHVPGDGGGLLDNVGAALAGPTKQLKRLAGNFEELSKQWTQVGRNINLLVQPRTTDEVDRGGEPANLATVLARADQRLAELHAVLDGINQWVNDAQLRDDVRATAANARSLTHKLDESIDTLTQRYFAVADDLSKAIGSMQKTIDQARQGEGTIGKLLSDPALYNNLNDAAERVGAMLDELKLLIQKWKAEGVPVQF